LGGGVSLVGRNRFNGFPALDVMKLLKKLRDPRLTPLKRGVNETATNQINLDETLPPPETLLISMIQSLVVPKQR